MTNSGLAKQKLIDKAQYDALFNHEYCVLNMVTQHLEADAENDRLDGTGGQYDKDARHYRQLAEIKSQTGQLTWSDILLNQVFEMMAGTDPTELAKHTATVEATLRRWLMARARRDA